MLATLSLPITNPSHANDNIADLETIPTAEDGSIQPLQQCWFDATACECLADGVWGVCRRNCESSQDCPSGTTCQAMQIADEGAQMVCIPPPLDCGWLTYEGQCQQNSVSYCGVFGPTGVDCKGFAGDNGRPMRCAMIEGFAQCVENHQCGRESRGPYVTRTTAYERMHQARAEGYSTSNSIVPMWDQGSRLFGFYIYHGDC